MTYHVLHIMTAGSKLYVDRGFLVCRLPDETQNRIALVDVRSIIVVAPQVSFSNEAIARLLSNDVVVLHCDSRYKAVGWSMPLDKVVRVEAFKNQVSQNADFEMKLWKKILRQKLENQAYLLDENNIDHDLYEFINKPLMNEANIAKKYWNHYFKLLNKPQTRERRGAESFENSALNYGYAVIGSLILRSILIHGLLPNLGIHHKERYASTPLVYDLMEPLRPFVDKSLLKFIRMYTIDESDFIDFKDWIKFIANSLKDSKIESDKKRDYKLMDAIDLYINSVTRSFINFDTGDLWVPELEKQQWVKGMKG